MERSLSEEMLTERERKEGYALQDSGQGGVFLVKGGKGYAFMSRVDLTRSRVYSAVNFHRQGFVKGALAVRMEPRTQGINTDLDAQVRPP